MTESEFRDFYPDCRYVTEEIRCESCGFEVSPVVQRKMLGAIHGTSKAAVDTVVRGRIHKVGGRGMPFQLICDPCFIQPRVPPMRELAEFPGSAA